jgi:hypothetical protein
VGRTRAHVFEREGNPYWPLPKDYVELTKAGRRQARVNACLMDHEPKLAVHSWKFFQDWYLRPDPEEDFHPMWFVDYRPPAPFHYHMVWWFEQHMLSMTAFPRGGGKTTTARSYLLKKLITTPQLQANAYFSKFKPFVVTTADMLKTQLETNERIIGDFGSLVPPRGKAPWSSDQFRLTNFASLSLWSIDGKMRGSRTQLSIIDDIDQDEKGHTLDTLKAEEIIQRITQVIAPTMDGRAHIGVIGTIPDLSCFLNYAMKSSPKGENVPHDPRFYSVEEGGLWHKAHFRWCDEKGNPLWSSKYTEEFIRTMKQLLGPSRFDAEFNNNPRSAEDAILDIKPEQHYYHVEPLKPSVAEQPFAYDGVVRYGECSGTDPVQVVPREMAWKEWLEGLYRVVTVDFAYTTRETSDWSVIHVGGLDQRNDLWSLDLWAGKVDAVTLYQKLFEMVKKWRVGMIGVQSVAGEEGYHLQIREKGLELEQELGYVPVLLPIKVPHNLGGRAGQNKFIRMSGLEPRFAWGKVKFPAWRQAEQAYGMLEHQILHFTIDGRNLAHDDCLDTLELLQRMLKHSDVKAVPTYEPETPIDRLKEGERFYEGTRIPLMSGLEFTTLREKDREAILMAGRQAAMAEAFDDPDADYFDDQMGVADPDLGEGFAALEDYEWET